MPPKANSAVMEQLDEARSTCRQLMGLLKEETGSLTQPGRQPIPQLEDNLQFKRQLSLRLERLVQSLKTLTIDWDSDGRSREAARLLANEMGEFQRVAAKNMLQLKAAHQVRADVIAMLKDTLETNQAPLGYSKDGSLQRAASSTVMRKEI